MNRYSDESLDDYIDRRESHRIQRLSDAFAEGKQAEGMNDDDIFDAADLAYDEHRQQMADAYHEGLTVGRMGLGAGLCPLGYCNDERNEWLRGFRAGAAILLNERKAA